MSEFRLENFSAIGFDFDDTLASGGLHHQARLKAYEQMAVETNDDRFTSVDPRIHMEAHYHATSTYGINAWVLAEAGLIDDAQDINNEYVQRIANLKISIYRQLISRGQDAIPGSPYFVKRVSSRLPGRLGIVTTASCWEVAPFLTRYGLNPYFPKQRIITAEDLNDPGNVKPHPEAYKILLGRLAIKIPSELLVIEDGTQGIESAKQAGTTVIAIATSTNAEELSSLTGHQKADTIAESYDEISSLLGL